MSEEPTSRPRRGIPDSSRQDEEGDVTPQSPSTAGPDAGPARTSAPRRGIPVTDDDAVAADRAADDPDAAFRRPSAGSTRTRRRGRRADRTATASRGRRTASAATTPPAPGSTGRHDRKVAAASTGDGDPSATRPERTAPADSRPAQRRAEPDSDELVVDHSPIHRWWLWSLVAVLLVAIVVVTVSRLSHQTPIADGPSASTSGSAGGSVTPLPRDALMTVSEATRLAPKASWREGSTRSTVADDSPEAISCIVRGSSLPNPLSTWQRSFSAGTSTGTSALNRVDSYSDEATARTAFTTESTSLAACDSVPALIVSASSVTGLADQATSMTVAFQGTTTQYHTIVLARFGREIQAVDAADNHAPISAASVASALGSAAGRSCTLAGGTCPTRVTTASIVPPSPRDPGWLITSDLPRLTPDQGEWQAATPAGVSSKGTQCEGVTLATVSGPTGRQQRTYLLYKDSSAPQGFGVDTLRFSFADASAASTFAKKIGDNIARCSKTLATAKVSDAQSFTGVGERAARIAGRSFLVNQDAGSGQHVVFQVSISTVGSTVTYLLANVTPSYRFSNDAWSQLAVRAAQRASQAR